MTAEYFGGGLSPGARAIVRANVVSSVIDGGDPGARGADRRAWLAAAAYLARTSGLAAVRRALPTYLGLFVVVVILFAGNGMRSADVVALARASPPARCALLAAWLLLALPAARAVVVEPAAFWIRVWPVPRAAALAAVIALLAAVEAPWILLWAKGGGGVAAGWAAAVALAGHGLALGRPRTPAEVGAAAGWVAAIALLPWAPLGALGAAAPAVGLGVRRAWIAAPERSGVQRAVRVVVAGRWPAVTWARAQLAMMVRGQRPAAARAIWLVAGGAFAARLAIANNGVADGERARAIWRVAAALAAAWGAAGLVGGVRRVEAQARWLLDVCGASAATRRAGAWLALVAPAAALAAAAGALLAWAGRAPAAPLAMVADGAAAAGAGAAVAAACGRWACRGDGRDGARLLPTLLAASAALAPLAFVVAPGPLLWLPALATLAAPDGASGRAPRGAGGGGPPSLAGEA